MSNFQKDKERFQEALKSLNNIQRETVLSDADSLQILAGPGSGKTRVLTFRVAYLVIEKKIYPGDIIVVTFTTKAAAEMKSRLVNLIGQNRTDRLLIGTFHAICSRLLHQHAAFAGVDPKFTICDTDQSKDIISKIQKDPKVEINEFTRHKQTAGAILGLISKAKSQGMDEVAYKEAYGQRFETRNIAIVFQEYERELERQNLLDFDNLLLKSCVLLRRKKDVLAKIKAVLVDEYQDTNIVQYDLIKLMMEQVNSRTLTIVGDPDQSIFGWRSAEPKNFGKMQEDFTETSAISMEQNYRSTSKVIDAAMHVITQDYHRIDKSLYTNNPEGIPMSLIATEDAHSEALFVATEIKKAIRYSKGLIQYKDIAVLMRMNFLSEQFESVFRLQKIPFTMVGGARFFDRVEVKDMTSYLLFSYNPRNVTAFSRIVNVPKRGIGEVWMKRIMETNRDNNEDMLTTLNIIVNKRTPINFTPAILSRLREFVNICEHVRSMIDKKDDVGSILNYIYEATDYEKYLKEHYFKDHESRWQNLGELLNIAKRTQELVDRTSNSYYDQNGFQAESEDEDDESLYDSDIDLDGDDFIDIDMDKYAKPKSPKAIEYATAKVESPQTPEPKVKPEKAEPSNIKVKTEQEDYLKIPAEIRKSESSKKEKKEEDEKPVKLEQDVNLEGLEDENKMDIEDDEDSEPKPEKEEYVNVSIDPIAEFLEYCSLCSNQKEQDEAESEGGKVTIATMHSSKGLEWPCVFVVTCSEGVIPHSRCEDIAEEGRLLYVAMTRSKFLLYCSSPKSRDMWGQHQRSQLSRFLSDMNVDLYCKNPPEWDSEMRTMLAETINRPIPERDEKLTTRKKSNTSKLKDATSSKVKKEESEAADIRFGVNGSRADLELFGGFSSASSLHRPIKKESKNSNASKLSSANGYDQLMGNHKPSKKAKIEPQVKKEIKKEVSIKEPDY